MIYKAIQDPYIQVKMCSVFSFEKSKLLFSVQRNKQSRFQYLGTRLYLQYDTMCAGAENSLPVVQAECDTVFNMAPTRISKQNISKNQLLWFQSETMIVNSVI
jgi:hypothetical protein